MAGIQVSQGKVEQICLIKMRKMLKFPGLFVKDYFANVVVSVPMKYWKRLDSNGKNTVAFIT